MDIRSPAFGRKRPYAVCSVILMCGYWVSIGAQKNGLRRLRAGLERMVRPAGAAGSRPAERRVSDCSGARSAACRMPSLRHREARTVEVLDGTVVLAFIAKKRKRRKSPPRG